jgi:septum site-determining protein MinC
MTEFCFQLKGSVVTVLLLELHHYSAEGLAQQLRQKIEKAPQLLLQSPIVIGVDKLGEGDVEVDFDAIVQQCRDLGLQPIGFRSCERYASAIKATGLAVLPQTSGRSGAVLRELMDAPGEQQAGTESAAAPVARSEPELVRRPSKLITQPVRSGQQIYAKDCDLIVMSQVSEGAEVLADGNIHVYGGLRGRALAGVLGDESARIFCHSLEAELLSVAGNFMLSEDFRDKVWKQPVQVFLKQESLCIEPL